MKYMSFLSILYHRIFFKIKIYGSNKLYLGNDVLLWKSKLIVKGKENVIKLGNDVKLERTEIKVFGNNNKVTFSNSVKIYDFCQILIEGNNCEINIGSRTTIGSAHIFCGESNTSVNIGKNCMISREVFINTSDFHSILDRSSGLRINPPESIIVGDNVWIGFNCRINKGSTVGQNSVVATGAIVANKKYPDNVILGGLPAKIIKENIMWSREKLPY